MNLILNRKYFSNTSTIGELMADGGATRGAMICNTLEDTCRRDLNNNGVLDRSEKVYGETAIPSGRYTILFEWSEKYKRKMPFLYGRRVGRNLSANLFNDVMIHWGNTPSHSLGCILVGQYDPKIPNWISHSRLTFNVLVEKLINGERPIHMEIMGGLAAEQLVA